MAKNKKKVSINTLDKAMTDNYTDTISAEWCDTAVDIKTVIDFKEMLEFVNDVVMSAFQDKYGFMPELIDFTIRSNIVSRYTNISLPDKLEHRYRILYGTDLINFVSQHINTEQLNEIQEAIRTKINYLCDTNIVNFQKQMKELIFSLESMQKQTSDLYANLTPDDILKITSAFEDGKLDENKIVEAYLQKTRPPKTEDEV